MGDIKRNQAVRRRRRRRKRRGRRRQRRILWIVVLSVILLAAVIGGALAAMTVFHGEHGNSGENKKRENHGEQKEDGMTEKSSAVINLKEGTLIQIRLGETFTDPGYTAEDKDGTDLTSQVKVDTSALNRAGNQKVIYTVKDSRGCPGSRGPSEYRI